MKFKLLLSFIVLLVILIAAIVLINQPAPLPVVGDVHIHADFKVYIDGQQLNFSQDKYMSTNLTKLSSFVHLHDWDGDVIHIHIVGVTLGEFFHSLKMSLNSTCFSTENITFCNTSAKTLKVYVNGAENGEFDRYVIEDLDKILISYGSANLTQELNSITDKACIQSNKCPERGVPEDESSCVTGSDCIA